MDFIPQYHFKNASGQWKMRPFNPAVAIQAANEARGIAAVDAVLAPIVDEGTSFKPNWVKRRQR